DDEVVDLGLPAGTVGATASWVGDTLHVPFASPDLVAGLVAVRPDAAVAVDTAATGGERVTAPLASVPRPAGPGDAAVCEDWRAAAGTAVVAVNPRGSRGYRGAHEALRDGWGGADLADVHAVGTAVAKERGGPVALFGVSYGAFLALLALGTRPAPWSRATVVA